MKSKVNAVAPILDVGLHVCDCMRVEPDRNLQMVAAGKLAAQEQALPVTLDRDGAISTVRLDGDVDIGAALELKALFVDALASGRELRVRLDGASCLDIAIFQLIWVARREAVRAGLEFSIEGHVPEEIALAMAEAGLEALPVSAT
jgi:hypothetical protein